MRLIIPPYLFNILLILLSLSSKAQNLKTDLPDSLDHYIDTVFTILQTRSIYTNTVDWAVLADSVNKKVSEAKTIQDLMPAVEFLYQSLGDKHGYLLYKNKRYGIPLNHPDVRDELAEGFKLGARVICKVIEGNYGYLLIPSMWSPSSSTMNESAQQIQDSLCAISQNHNIKGWIIDLRMNLGGNMYPMLAGIGNILGDGILGAFISADSTRTSLVFIMVIFM